MPISRGNSRQRFYPAGRASSTGRSMEILRGLLQILATALPSASWVGASDGASCEAQTSFRIRRQTYRTRKDAGQGVFDYIEMFYNPKQKRAERNAVAR